MINTPRTKPSADQKQLARFLASTFGGEYKVMRRWDELETTSIAVLEASSVSASVPKSFATVGLFESPNTIGDNQANIPIEILGASFDDRMANVLATLAFRKIKDGHVFSPDSVSENAIGLYDWDVSTAHILFTDVISWEIGPHKLEESDRVVHFLQALPITDSEFEFALDNGADALLRKVPAGSEDYFHLNREPFV